MTYDPRRVVTDLRALADHTGGPEGSRRLAWTPDWLQARAMLRESLTTLPVEVDEDEAGNLWAVLRGRRDEMLVVGSHLDSVPKGGWLDGALGVMSVSSPAVRELAPITVVLVDWADEEVGVVRRSLFGFGGQRRHARHRRTAC
jgi:N-carbamoyl-L-amino-acid hydrolase